jgi:hypothetical protein
MAEEGFPNFFPRGSRPVRPGMFGGRRVPSLGGNGRPDASSTAWPLSASATRSSITNDAGMLTQPGSREPAAAPPRRSALTGLSVTADQLEEWVKEINSTGGLDEPVPGPTTLNSDGDVRKALKHSAQDRGGPDTIEDLDLDDFADRFRQASRKLRLNGLQKNRLPEIFFTFGRNDRGQVVLLSLHALGTQGQRGPAIPDNAIGIGHGHSRDLVQPPHMADASYLYATGKPSFVIGQRNFDLYQIERHNGLAQIRVVRRGGRFGPWERFQTDPNAYRVYNDQR